jgi:hypothetical protein
MSKEHKSTTLRVKVKGIELSPAARKKLESDLFRFIAQLFHYCGDHHVAFPDGAALTFPHLTTGTFFGRPKRKQVLTKRQKEINREKDMPILFALREWKARDEAERAKIMKLKGIYETACFGKLRSQRKRTAFEFLRHWRRSCDDESTNPEPMSLIVPMKFISLAPLLNALKELDAEFFDGLAEAMRVLDSYLGKDPTDKWLLENEEEIRQLTPREIKEQFGSRFLGQSVKQIHKRLHELDLKHENELRGKASPNYRQRWLKYSPPTKKKG